MRLLLCISLLALCIPGRPLAAANEPIVIVKGTASTPNLAEKNYSGRIAKRLSQWLDEIKVSHRVLTDEDVAGGELGMARVAILTYNPNLPPREITALRNFVQRGGKLIVFYSNDSNLAELVGVRLGKYKPASNRGAWSSFKFIGGPAYMPRTVYQQSWNIRPVTPLNKNGKVIAWWHDAAGNQLKDPAWVETPNGLWMSHVLLMDDAENKKQMLLAMLGEWVPGVWKAAADEYMLTHSRIGSASSIDAALKEIRQLASAAKKEERVQPVLDQCLKTYKAMHKEFDQRQYPQCIVNARYLRTLLSHAYGLAQQPASKEFRAMWNHSGIGLYPGSWDATCRMLSENGFNAVFPNMLWAGAAHYPSRLVPASETLKRYGDQMKPCMAAAKKHGLEVHVWKVCWTLDQASEEFIARMKKESRLARTAQGKDHHWLCPTDPRNRKMEKDALLEAAKKYRPDGVHLDYIRYKDIHNCFCNGCRNRFQQTSGITIANWPADAATGRHESLYKQWRAKAITDFVAELRSDLSRIDKNIELSAAVFGSYPSCVTSIGQDWGNWLKNDLVDFVCPMTYTPDLAQFKKLTDRHLALPGGKKVYPGIGVRSNEANLDAYQTIEQIRALRQSGAKGFVIFDLKSDVPRDILPVLSLGTTATTP